MPKSKSSLDGLEGVFKRGVAVGYSDIKRDEITFRFRRELFTFPTVRVMRVARYNGYFYEADIKDIREMAREKH